MSPQIVIPALAAGISTWSAPTTIPPSANSDTQHRTPIRYSNQNASTDAQRNPAMQITPKQRRRAVRVHFLSLQGNSHKEIAESFKISRATVRADLQLIETHWSEIAAAAADDLLLESLQLLEGRVTLATRDKSIDELANRLTPVEYLRARDAQRDPVHRPRPRNPPHRPRGPSASRATPRPTRPRPRGTQETAKPAPN